MSTLYTRCQIHEHFLHVFFVQNFGAKTLMKLTPVITSLGWEELFECREMYFSRDTFSFLFLNGDISFNYFDIWWFYFAIKTRISTKSSNINVRETYLHKPCFFFRYQAGPCCLARKKCIVNTSEMSKFNRKQCS